MPFPRSSKSNPLVELGISREQVLLLRGKRSHLNAVIKTLYFELSKLYHPDNAKTGNAERFRAVNSAYELLKDPETLAEAVRTLADKQADPYSLYQQAVIDTVNRETEWAEKLVQLTLARSEPYSSRLLALRVESMSPKDDEFTRLGIESDTGDHKYFDVTIKDGRMKVDAVVPVPITRGGPKGFGIDIAVLHRGIWYQRYIDPDRRVGDRYMYVSTGNPRELVFLGTAPAGSKPQEMFTPGSNPESAAIAALSAGASSDFAANYPPRMVLPLLRSVRYDDRESLILGLDWEGTEPRVVIVGAKEGDPKWPKVDISSALSLLENEDE